MAEPVRIVVATPHPRYDPLVAALAARPELDVVRVRERQGLTLSQLQALAPRYVFFPHWSWIIPPEIHQAFECVIFHMTDVPFGRGGSPLQNLIARGIYETRLTALRCSDALDAGPVYAKQPLSLHGGAEEILVRAAGLMQDMVLRIATEQPQPQAQHGEVVTFARRRPEQSDLSGTRDLQQVHDMIRMLDAEGYPHAFLQVGPFRLEFTRSRLAHDHVLADVRITRTAGDDPA